MESSSKALIFFHSSGGYKSLTFRPLSFLSLIPNSLAAKGFDYVPSHTSLLIFPIEMEGKEFLNKMTELKVGVRAFQFMDKNWCRVSMGTMDEMKMFTAAIDKVLV